MVQRLGWLGLGMLVGIAGVGWASSVQIELEPRWPDYLDAVVLYISGTWDTLCTPRDPQVSFEGLTIRVRLSVPSGPCPKAAIPWRLRVPLGRLARGHYEVQVVLVEPTGATRALGDLEFVVVQPNWLYWMSQRPLTWEDFLGPVPRRPGQAVAQVCLDLTYEYSAVARSEGAGFLVRLQEVRVDNRVDRHRSWVLPEHKRPEVLEHEQIHFDINEVYRRLLQEEMNRLALRLELRAFDLEDARRRLRDEVDKVYQRFWQKCQEVHDLFDEAVEKGGLAAQREWREKVSRWLRNPREAPQP
ncbi:MAG: hypothetical protein N2507_06205 [Candidatus Bipolaricaulota bacterium]|nr:hypothetical protein [Candidatus Bipolaricaulota bacterium]